LFNQQAGSWDSAMEIGTLSLCFRPSVWGYRAETRDAAMPDTPEHLPRHTTQRRWRRRLPVAALVTALVTVLVAAALTVGDDRAGDDPSATGASTSTTRRSTTTSSTSTTPPTTAAPAPPPVPAAAVGSALCIGDSVMLGASPQYLNTLSMCGTVDAELSRQFSGAPAAVAAHAPYPAAVVVHLGNNGTVDRDDVDAVMAHLAGVSRVVFVTVQLSGTRPWEGQANGEIRAIAGRYPNVVVADWKAASDGHPDYTRGDGIHMSPAGAGVYAATIAAVL
jgi:hypothetical protein